MPLTPFHLGPALFFGLLLFSAVYLPTFLVANIIVDFEPFLVLIFRLNYPLHGFFHSFLGGSIIAAILSLVMIRVDERIQKIMRLFKLEQQFFRRSIWIASFSGVYLHIMLDSRLYTDIKPFFPLSINPLYSGARDIRNIRFLCDFVSIGCWFICVQNVETQSSLARKIVLNAIKL